VGATAYPVIVASARVRIAAFSPFLRPHGIDLCFQPSLREDEYALLASGAAAVRKAAVLARSALRGSLLRPDAGLLLIHRLRLLSPLPGVDPPRHLDAYDLDDALFLGSAALVNRRFRWAKREATRSLTCMKRARLVIAGNRFLADHARRVATRVEVVPSCVDPSTQPVRAHAAAEIATIGWIGSHTTAGYLKPILPAIARLNRDRPRARLVVIGADTGVRQDWVEHRPWSLERQPRDLAEFDIGIMPLPDTDWARGKCGYKLLQYFSAGVPAVASPVGVAVDLINDERGLLASSADDWHLALDQLVSDERERAERGRNARVFAEQGFSYQRWAPELASMLQSLAN
jgi:glycosyltransferase involved in cell wall biosynthesis